MNKPRPSSSRALTTLMAALAASSPATPKRYPPITVISRGVVRRKRGRGGPNTYTADLIRRVNNKGK